MAQSTPEDSQGSRTEDNDEEMQDGFSEMTTESESFIRHGASSALPAAAAQRDSLLSNPATISLPASASDILRPLSEVAAQRAFPLPTSGSLAWLARHHLDHADGGQIDDYESIRTTTNPAAANTTSSSSGSSGISGSSSMHERLLQSDSIMNATATNDLSSFEEHGTSSSNTDALQRFMAAVWESSRTEATADLTATTASILATSTSEPLRHTSVYSSSSPLSSPSSSFVEGSSGLEEPPIPLEDPQLFASPYASLFPEGTHTYPLAFQRYDDQPETSPDTEEILKYSESIQFFRRRPEDGGQMWKRRVFEYR